MVIQSCPRCNRQHPGVICHMTGDNAVVRLWRIGMTATSPMEEAIYATGRVSPLAIDKAVDEHNGLRSHALAQAAEIERLTREVQRRDLLLQSLTPMGSEYVNDPERCVAYAKEVRTGHFERWKKVALELKASEARTADLLKALEEIANTDSNRSSGNILAAYEAMRTVARAALAAAKGETV